MRSNDSNCTVLKHWNGPKLSTTTYIWSRLNFLTHRLTQLHQVLLRNSVIIVAQRWHFFVHLWNLRSIKIKSSEKFPKKKKKVTVNTYFYFIYLYVYSTWQPLLLVIYTRHLLLPMPFCGRTNYILVPLQNHFKCSCSTLLGSGLRKIPCVMWQTSSNIQQYQTPRVPTAKDTGFVL